MYLGHLFIDLIIVCRKRSVVSIRFFLFSCNCSSHAAVIGRSPCPAINRPLSTSRDKGFLTNSLTRSATLVSWLAATLLPNSTIMSVARLPCLRSKLSVPVRHEEFNHEFF